MKRKASKRASGAVSTRSIQADAKHDEFPPKSLGVRFREYILAAAKKETPIGIPLLSVVICAFMGGGIILYATRWGVGLSTDSLTYLNVARNFLKGYGLSVFPAHYPPLYPLVLSLSGPFGHDPLDGARWFQAFLFCGTLAFSGLIIYRETRGSNVALIIGLLLLLTSGTIISVYSYAWSESLFIFFALAGFLSLGEYLEESKPLFLVVSSILIGFSFLTRYIGISFVVTGCLSLLIISRESLVKRFIIASVFGIISIFPTSIWILKNWIVAGTLANRPIAYHPVGVEHVNDAISAISGWFHMPQEWPLKLRGALLVVFIIIILAGYVVLLKHQLKCKENLENRRILCFPSLSVIFLFSYVILLCISLSFVDAHTPVDLRILSPLHIVLTIGIVCLAYQLWYNCWRRFIVAISFLFIAFLLLVNQVVHAIPSVATMHNDGRGFSNKYWRHSNLVQLIKSLPDDTIIYTNGGDAIDLFTGKNSLSLPPKIDPVRRVNYEDFPSQFANIIEQINSGKAILVYFNMITWRWYLPTREELDKNLGGRVLYQGWDGIIYGVK